MISVVFFFLLTTRTPCLTSEHRATAYSNRACYLSFGSGGYEKCLWCTVSLLPTPINPVALTMNGQRVQDLHCVILVFESTASFRNITADFAQSISQTFSKQNIAQPSKTNSLSIQIQNDTTSEFGLDDFRLLDQTRNRSYHGVRFDLTNRSSREPLLLNQNLKNMTFTSIQINILCQTTGLNYYNYDRAASRRSLIRQLQCQLPGSSTTRTTLGAQHTTDIIGTTDIISTTAIFNTTVVFSTTASSTKKKFEKLALMVGLIGCGSLLPCLLLAICIYILCKRRRQQHEPQTTLAESVSSDETASMASGYSY